MTRYKQGKYRVKNPEKYKGDPTNVIYRSGWERVIMTFFDTNKSVLEWRSEEKVVPYRSPVDGKVHRYFPDFIVTVQEKDGNVKTYMVEVKPYNQTKPPKEQKRKTRNYYKKLETYAVNQAKWESADKYCKENNMEFKILTENEIFGNAKSKSKTS